MTRPRSCRALSEPRRTDIAACRPLELSGEAPTASALAPRKTLFASAPLLVRAKGAFGGFRASAGVLATGPAHVKLYSYFRTLRERIWRSRESCRAAVPELALGRCRVASFSANLQAFRLVRRPAMTPLRAILLCIQKPSRPVVP